MADIKCPKCDRTIDSGSKVCPFCQDGLATVQGFKPPKPESDGVATFLNVLGVIVLVGGVIGAIVEGSPMPLIYGMAGGAMPIGLARIIGILNMVKANTAPTK